MNAKKHVAPGNLGYLGGEEVPEGPRDPGEPGPGPEGGMEMHAHLARACRRLVLLHRAPPYPRLTGRTRSAHATTSIATARVVGMAEWFIQCLR